MNQLRNRVPKLLREFWSAAQEDDIGGLASELAFKLTLSIFPLLIFLAAASSYVVRIGGFDDPATDITDSLGDSLPTDASSVMEKAINDVLDGSNAGLLSFGALATLWPASGAARALTKAVNRVNDLPDQRPGWRKTLLSLELTLFGGLALIAAITGLVLSDVFAGAIAEWAGLSHAWGWATRVARIPIVVLFVVIAAQLLFWLAPAARPRFSLWSPGAAAFGLAWALFSAGFSLYVSNFGSYSATYGSLAGVAVFLVWLNLSCWLLLAGCELNWVLAHRQPELPVGGLSPVPSALPAAFDSPAESDSPSVLHAAEPDEPLHAPAGHEENRKNVEDRLPAQPARGFGQLWHKEISTTLTSQSVPEAVMAFWSANMARLWPSGGDLFTPRPFLEEGDVLGVDVSVGPVTLSTGVLVAESGPDHVTVLSPEGHMFAGWNRFSTSRVPNGVRVAVTIEMRAWDPMYEAGLSLGGHRQEEMFWAELLRNLAAEFGEKPRIRLIRRQLDRSRQWSKVGNLRSNALLSTWGRKARSLLGGHA